MQPLSTAEAGSQSSPQEYAQRRARDCSSDRHPVWMSGIGPGSVKTRSDLVVMPTGARIFAFIRSPCAHAPQKSWCVSTAQSFHTAWAQRRTVQPAAEWVRLLGYSGHWPSDFGNARL